MTDNLEQIKQYYANCDDFKIERLAKNEAGGLRPEVIPILIEEIEKRGLNPNLTRKIENQIRELTENEFNELKLKITHLPCPNCEHKSSPLVGTWIRTVTSIIIDTSYTKKAVITCKSCANNSRIDAVISTLLYGWWGPWGLFQTPAALIATLIDTSKQKKISEDIITSFIHNNIAQLRSIRSNPKLVRYIRDMNGNN